MLRAAVVSPKNHGFCIFEGLGKVEYVLNLGSAEAVDALVIVSHNAEEGLRALEQLQKKELGCVGVLVLIHKYDLEAAVNVVPDLRVVLEQGNAL